MVSGPSTRDRGIKQKWWRKRRTTIPKIKTCKFRRTLWVRVGRHCSSMHWVACLILFSFFFFLTDRFIIPDGRIGRNLTYFVHLCCLLCLPFFSLFLSEMGRMVNGRLHDGIQSGKWQKSRIGKSTVSVLAVDRLIDWMNECLFVRSFDWSIDWLNYLTLSVRL